MNANPVTHAVAALLLMGLLGCGFSSSRKGNTMALKIDLRASRTEILYQESPAFDFTLANDGADPITLTHPGHSTSLPRVRLVDVKTGRGEVLTTGHEGFAPPPTQPLAPGAKITWSIVLSERGEIPGPGVYDVSLVHPYDTSRTAESNAVRLTVRPSTTANLSLSRVGSASGAVWNAAWVNIAAAAPQLVHGTFALGGEHPDLEQVAVLGPLAPGSKPRVSAPPNGVVLRDAWIAWVEGARLRAVHVAEQSGASPIRDAALPGGAAWAVVAVHSEPLVDPAIRPAGAVLLVQEAAADVQLAVAELSDKGPSLGATSPLPGARPGWIESVTRSDGTRIAVILQADGGRLVLRTAPWPGRAGKAATLGTWDGSFVAAGAAIDASDAVRGAILLREGGARSPLRLLQWTLGADGAWRETSAVALHWDAIDPPVWARVRVSGAGSAWALFRDAAGRTFLRAGSGDPREVVCTLGGAPDDLAFEGDHVALLLCAVPEHGFQLANPNGTPVSR